jgi:alkylhydroperoxidase family enzyme
MRLGKARIPPLLEEDMSAEQAATVATMRERSGRVFNVNKTLMRNMNLYKSWVPFARHTMSTSSLEPRMREILILRVAWNTESDYEWGQHTLMSLQAGLDAADHQRIKAGASADGWGVIESALISVADELGTKTMISEETWTVISIHLTTEQILDAIFTVGQYTMIAMALNSLGVQREPGISGFDG